MRKLLVSVALATATIAAVPAAAQYHGGNPGWHQRGPARPAINNLLRQLGQVDIAINRSLRRHMISRREAIGLRRQSNQIRARLGVASRGGLNRREFASLQLQVNRLEQRLTIERNDRDGRRF